MNKLIQSDREWISNDWVMDEWKWLDGFNKILKIHFFIGFWGAFLIFQKHQTGKILIPSFIRLLTL